MLITSLKLLSLIIFLALLLTDLPTLWQNFHIPYQIKEAQALNLVANWNFNGNSTGWSPTNDNGTNVCGDNNSSTADANMATLAYGSSVGGQTAFQGISSTGKAAKGRGMVHQQITAPGSGTIKAKGIFSYYANASDWNTTANSSWIRLDIYNSANSTYIANLGCVSLNSNQAWTTTSLSSDINLTGGTTYTIRATMRAITKNTNGAPAVTLAVDNILVTFSPVGLGASSVIDSTNSQLSWTASTAGSGANGLHGTTPYKVYRSTSAPVTESNFLANATTNSYIDGSATGNTTYYYAVTNIDTSSTESPLSAESSILTRPGAPTSLTFSNVADTSLTISWSVPTGGATSYKIERCSGSGCSDFVEITAGETATSFNDSPLIAGTLYSYRIKATNATGDGTYSSTAEQSTTSTPVISVSISDGIISYGVISEGGTQDTTSTGLNDTQVATNDGNITENFNIKGQNSTSWTLTGSVGYNQYKQEFCITGGGAPDPCDSSPTWTVLTTAYQSLATAIASSGTQRFDLKITLPSLSSTYNQQTVDITIQAVQP